MRVYDVQFLHVKHGSNWTSERVVVRGFVEEAIAKARRVLGRAWAVSDLKPEQVTLISECK